MSRQLLEAIQPAQQGRLCVKVADWEKAQPRDGQREIICSLASGMIEASSVPRLHTND